MTLPELEAAAYDARQRYLKLKHEADRAREHWSDLSTRADMIRFKAQTREEIMKEIQDVAPLETT